MINGFRTKIHFLNFIFVIHLISCTSLISAYCGHQPDAYDCHLLSHYLLLSSSLLQVHLLSHGHMWNGAEETGEMKTINLADNNTF